MGATSKHYGDIAIWIEKIIDSCETPQQDSVARTLVRHFDNIDFNLDEDIHYTLSRSFRMKLDRNLYSRMDKKIELLEKTKT